MAREADILVIGYGNPGRLDDGLGPALARQLEAACPPGVTVESDYQLTVEDAATAARHEVVIFADADASGPAPFRFRPVRVGDARGGFSTHAVEPEQVLGLARELFAAGTKGYTLGIRGYEFRRFGERLSPGARANLAAAVEFLLGLLRTRRFDDAAAGHADPGGAGRDIEERP